MHRYRNGSTLKEELAGAMNRLESAGVVYPEGYRERLLETYTTENVPYPYIVLHVGDPRIVRHFYYPEAVKQTGRLLDYGCGTGDAVRQLLRAGYPREMVTGFDVNGKSIDLGMALYADRDENADLFRVSPAFPFEPGSFDIIYSGSVFHVIADEDEFREYLQNAFDGLRAGGIFFGSTLGLRDDAAGRPDAGPPRLMKRHEMLEHMAEIGFSVLTVREGDRYHMHGAAPGFCVFEFLAEKNG
ncbi:MAG TPA: class I SAM-dependent methyltransferase [Methanofollis liminatans]|uniref:Class I SAM-dependent methyltransferase n=1 Tax=Methanofollis liminatans TaxID=2201 RepID=A0A831LQL9_9EURY|nr:class I SAM-dependent methyltransferase [Methanofollis liminatans]